MGSLRSTLKDGAAVIVPFGFAMLTFVAIPSSVGYQDLASLIANRTAIGDHTRDGSRTQFGVVHAATFNFPRPVGSAIPEPTGYRVASLDLDADRETLTGSIGGRALFDLSARPPALDRDTVNRTRKGDRVVPRAVAEWMAREQAARTAATPLAAPETPAAVAALPADAAAALQSSGPEGADVAAVAPAPAPKTRTGWPLVLPQTERQVAAEIAAESTPAPAAAATTATPVQAAAPTVGLPPPSPEAFSASSMAWLGGQPEPSTRQARAKRTTSTKVAAVPHIKATAPAEAPSKVAAAAPTVPEIPAVAATPAKSPAKSTAQVPIETTEPAADPMPQQSFVLASAGSDIVVPRSVTPKAELAGPPEPAAEAIPADVSPQADAPHEHAPLAALPAGDSEPFHPDTAVPTLGESGSPTLVAANVYFGAAPLAGAGGALQPWSPNGAPMATDPDAELAALDEITPSAATLRAAIDPDGGETIARKGEVMPGDGRALRSPAERLGLFGGERAKAEKCLADAVYFESRGEPLRGQIAVAQVVMNRVFSGYYPADVCGVVYQNAHRHLSCQFTFACDGIKDKITEPDAWERAQRVSSETLDGKHWLADVGKATHYHAYWVRPWWARTMHKLDKIGVHTFYRPRAWGDGADRPAWGDASLPPPAEKIADKL